MCISTERRYHVRFFKNKSKGKVICSPCNGRVVPITEVPDPTFSEKILGDGVAVIPSEGRFYAPADGEVTAVFDTLHAFTMTTTQGVELLLHIGLDTVTLRVILLHHIFPLVIR